MAGHQLFIILDTIFNNLLYMLSTADYGQGLWVTLQVDDPLLAFTFCIITKTSEQKWVGLDKFNFFILERQPKYADFDAWCWRSASIQGVRYVISWKEKRCSSFGRFLKPPQLELWKLKLLKGMKYLECTCFKFNKAFKFQIL